jgi:hypothetical protein
VLNFVSEIYGFTSNDNPRASYLSARGDLIGKSKRAKEIIELVEASPLVIDVVVGTSVGQESAFRGAVGTETSSKLVWDPTVAFPILVDAQQVTTSRQFMGKELKTTKTTAKLAPLPPEIVLIHELGHAAQFMKELGTYATLFAAGKDGIAEIEADNLARNEWPICDDYGLMRRSSYLHYKGSNETAKWAITGG